MPEPTGRRVLVDPSFRHESLAAWLAGAGWRAAGGTTTAPLVPGEPEATTWGWPGSAVLRVGTSYNPVLPLRALDLTWVPATWRRRFVAELPTHDVAHLERLLATGTPRERTYAIAGLVELEATTSGAALQAAAASPTLARAARAALDALGRIVTARTVAEASLATFTPLAVAACERLLTPDPRFELALADFVAPEVADLLADLPRPTPLHPGQGTRCTVELSPAFALRSPGPMSRRLSPPWTIVAPWLRDGPIWAAATWSLGARKVTRAEGIVFLGDRMGWFPKLPLRIAEALRARGIRLEEPGAN